jgi:hypothetical protein
MDETASQTRVDPGRGFCARRGLGLAGWIACGALAVLLLPHMALVSVSVFDAAQAAGVEPKAVALVVLLALPLCVACLWLVSWLRADRVQRVSTPNLLFLWSAASIALTLALRARGVEDPGEAAAPFAATALVALALLQHYLRRRWRSGPAETPARGQLRAPPQAPDVLAQP